MKVVIDTNVVLDLLLDREPHAHAAAQVFAYLETGVVDACLCATTITTIHYIAAKTVGDTLARQHIASLLRLLELAPVTRSVIEEALGSAMSDFEDAVLIYAAARMGAEAIITRNGRDFQAGPLRVYSPVEWLVTQSKS